ncbi:MAG: hypothetical protein AB1461_06830 [Thermodesulfobacteriota bacterium]
MLDAADFYWGVVVALAGAVWVVIVFIRDRHAASAERTAALIKRLHEIDQVIIEHPDIQKYLSLTAAEAEGYFRRPAVLQDDTFYKAKTFVYWHLNLFDEILSLAAGCKSGPALLLPRLLEFSDWESYIRFKCRHPLYRSVLNNESEIFGAALRDFWSAHQKAIEAAPFDPYSW